MRLHHFEQCAKNGTVHSIGNASTQHLIYIHHSFNQVHRPSSCCRVSLTAVTLGVSNAVVGKGGAARVGVALLGALSAGLLLGVENASNELAVGIVQHAQARRAASKVTITAVQHQGQLSLGGLLAVKGDAA